jgi:hypothetical protein
MADDDVGEASGARFHWHKFRNSGSYGDLFGRIQTCDGVNAGVAQCGGGIAVRVRECQ